MSSSKKVAVPVPTLDIKPTDEILTAEELKARLKFKSISSIYEARRPWHDDPLPAYRIGKELRFVWSHVLAWLSRHASGKMVA